MSSQIKLVAIVGETGSGKSSLAIEIAKYWDGEIVSADSRTIYKDMNIGTAKPSLKEREGIAHYGFDLVKPGEQYSAAQFKEYAQEVINDISKRGKLPILVGGTGLYVDGVLYNYSFGGSLNTVLRSQLNNKSVAEIATMAQENGIEVSNETLKNKRHLIRLIERGGKTERKNELYYNTLIIGVRISKNQLRKRIEARVERMFHQGLRKEYNDIKQKYGASGEAFTGIGYQEFAAWESGDASISEVKRQIVKNTMNLSKRQRTWFKRNPNIVWVESNEQALEHVEEFLK